MLCPEVCKFPKARILSSKKKDIGYGDVKTTIEINKFYKTLILTIPDELHLPPDIEAELIQDKQFYKIQCELPALLQAKFLNNFVRQGNLFCFSVGKSCRAHNCAAVSNKVLVLHVTEITYQTLGIEGKKKPNKFYEIRIDLTKEINSILLNKLTRVGTLEFYITWEPYLSTICPSSVAKYLYDNNIYVTVVSPEIKLYNPEVEKIPSTQNVELEELFEWTKCHQKAGLNLENNNQIVSYYQPECENPIESTRLLMAQTHGFYTPSMVTKLCDVLVEYLGSREADNYWLCLTLVPHNNCLWRFDRSRPMEFQYHKEASCALFLDKHGYSMFSEVID